MPAVRYRWLPCDAAETDLHAGAHAGEQQERGVEDPQRWILVAEAEPKGRATNPRKGMPNAIGSKDRSCRLYASSQCAHGDQQRAQARGAEAHGGAYLRARAVEEHSAREHLQCHWTALSVDHTGGTVGAPWPK
jgi:hypothetical protein